MSEEHAREQVLDLLDHKGFQPVLDVKDELEKLAGKLGVER